MTTNQQLSLSVGGEFLSVDAIDGQLVVYALVDDHGEQEVRTIMLVTSGQILSDEDVARMGYIGTIQKQRGSFHVFEIRVFD